MNNQEIIKIEDLPESLVKDPYQTILAWAERRFKKIGNSVFSYLALLPHSVFIPSIPYEDTYFSTGISFLLLTPPSGGKTLIGRAMEKLVVNPVPFEDISSAEMQTELSGKEDVTLITGDAGRIFKDPDLLKALEGILSDSRVSKRNKRERLDYEISGNCYMAGTPQDISSYIYGGFLSRIIPMVIMHKIEEQDEIGTAIVKSIGKSSLSDDITIKDISNYYKFLYQVQKGFSREISPIKGYYFDENFKNTILTMWKEYRKKLNPYTFDNYYRELIAGFKYLCSSSFLNINNRKIVDNQIVPTTHDLEIAIHLMQNELRTKIHILKSEKIARKIKDVEFLEKVSGQFKLTTFSKEMITVILEGKERR